MKEGNESEREKEKEGMGERRKEMKWLEKSEEAR